MGDQKIWIGQLGENVMGWGDGFCAVDFGQNGRFLHFNCHTLESIVV